MSTNSRSAQQLVRTDLLFRNDRYPRGSASSKVNATISTAVETKVESEASIAEVGLTPRIPNQRAVLASTTASFVPVQQRDTAETGSLCQKGKGLPNSAIGTIWSANIAQMFADIFRRSLERAAPTQTYFSLAKHQAKPKIALGAHSSALQAKTG